MKVSRIKLLLINAFAIFAFLTILGIASPGKANALINEDCSTASLHFYNPTIIVKVIDHTGGNVRYSRDFSVFATALVNPGLSATTSDGVDQRTMAIRWDGKLASPNAGSGISMRVNEGNDGITSCNLFGAQVPALKFGGGASDPRPILDCRYTRYNDGILHGLGFGIVADEVFDTGGLTGKWLPDETIVAQNGSTTFATSTNYLGKSAYTDYPVFRGGSWISVNGSQPTIVFTYQTDPPSSPVESNINTLDCTLQDVRGYAFYRPFGVSPVDIHVYVDGGPRPGVSPTWTITANQPSPGLPVPGGHGFSFSPRGAPGINYTVGHTLYFYAANVPGNPLIDIRSMPSITDPPCNNRSFTINPVASISADDLENPTDVDVNVTFQLTSPNNVKGVKVNCNFFVDYYPKGSGGRANKSFGTAVVNDDRELNIDNSEPSNNCDAINIDLTGPSYDVTAGDEICVSASVDPGSGFVAPDGTISSPGVARVLSENPTCKKIINKPYVSFYGGDVKVGGSHTGGTCTTDPKSKIRAFSRSGGRGSGTQFAAYALGVITGFNTARLNTAEGDNYLTFPNSADGFGSFGLECTHDYSTDSTDKDLANVLGSGINTTDLSGLEGKYKFANSLTVTGGTIGKGQHVYIYADGDITITEDIDFVDSGWANRNDIPVLYLVSKRGNIYIENDVKKLFGVYSAQMGNINTCVAEGFTSTPASFDKFTGCSNQLVVNGSFLAKKVQLNRTFGSLRNSATGENPFGGANACDGALAGVTAQGNGTCAAEVFIFNPAFYIARSPDEYSVDEPDGPLFDFYTNLPPFL